ncbi:LysR family transcriptional regulator, partial [Klebsiella pneumoniae]|uniref:LysR family transcriptional regulator n=1 Tax=Klebsiella pneumoniae TaxID=573 RepID=UPI001E28D1E0
PPALTVAINHLEEKLGVRLLNRSTRSLSLTAVGEEFLNNITPEFKMKDRNWLTVCTLIVVNLPAAIRVVRSADRGYFYSAPSP